MLVDFGIAKEYDLENTTTMLRHGSPGYAAPEHYCSGTDPRTDIYGLGATMYTLLTGNVPVDALMRLTHQTSKGKDPLEPVKHLTAEVPGPVADVIHRALSLRAEARFETVEQFWQALYQASLHYPSPPPRLWSLSAASLRMRARSVTERVPTLAFLKRSPASHTWRQRILPLLLLVLLIGLGLGSEFRSQVMNQPGTGPTPQIPTQHQPTQTAPSRSRNGAPISTPVFHHPVKPHHQHHGDGSNSNNQGGQGG
jgi:serine/threonine protein kinase